MTLSSHRSSFRFLPWLFLAVVLVFLYLPLVPPVLNSLAPGSDTGLFGHYRAITQSSILMEGIQKTWVLGVLTALITPLFALAIAAAIRAWKVPRLLVGLSGTLYALMTLLIILTLLLIGLLAWIDRQK